MREVYTMNKAEFISSKPAVLEIHANCKTVRFDLNSTAQTHQ